MAINFDNRYTDVSSDEMHLTDYLQAIVANWRSILMITLAITALGTAYAFIATPVYRADVLFHVVDKADNNNKQDGLQPLTGMFDTKPSTAAEIELMKSRLVTEETVKSLHLDIAARPHTLPFVGGLLAPLMNGKWGIKLPPALQLPSYAWGNESIKVSRFDTAKDMYDKDFTLIAGQNGDFVLNNPDGVAILEGRVGENVVRETPAGPITLRVDEMTGAPGTRYDLTRGSTLTTVERLQKAMDIGESTLQSGVIRASLEGHDPKLTADIMNSMAREFIRQDVESRSTEAEHMLAFLDQQLPQLRKELDAAE